jgi:Zn-dependent protease
MNFEGRELADLAAAWVALGVAFALFFDRPALPPGPEFAWPLAVNLATVGAGFLCHELAHKLVATRFGRTPTFSADYGMLFLAVAGGLAGFIFAAPGAVYYRGGTDRQHGIIALAGPVTNLLLAALFLPVAVVAPVLARGVAVNLLLAAFNMLPFGPLDGRSVWSWSRPAYLVVALPSGLFTVLLFL